MRYLSCAISLLLSPYLFADTMNHYMNIYNQIPQMEMKADPQAQAWARSARSILTVTEESIAETLLQANDQAKARGNPLFCPPAGTSLKAAQMNKIIVDTYRSISSQQSDKDKMTVSQIAWMGIVKFYPCPKNQMASTYNDQRPSQGMQHMNAFLKK